MSTWIFQRRSVKEPRLWSSVKETWEWIPLHQVGRLREADFFKVTTDQQLQRPRIVRNCKVVVYSLIVINVKISSGLRLQVHKQQTARMRSDNVFKKCGKG